MAETTATIAGVLTAVATFTLFCLVFYWLYRRYCRAKKITADVTTIKDGNEHVRIKINGSPLDPEANITLIQQQTQSTPQRSFTGLQRSRERHTLTRIPEISSPEYSPILSELNASSTSSLPSRKCSTFSSPSSLNETWSRNSTQIELSLVYVPDTQQLHVYIHRLFNLPLQYGKDYTTFIKAVLRATKVLSLRSNLPRKPPVAEYIKLFQFSNVTLKDLEEGSLEFFIHLRKHLKSKDIGICTLQLKDFHLETGEPQLCNGVVENIVNEKNIEAALAKKHDRTELGQLLISLQYQKEASRLKIFIRRAESLPPTKGILEPEYLVVINVTLENGIAEIKETKVTKGRNPVWNQAFLFDIKIDEIQSCWIHLTLIRKRSYGHNRAVGHVTLGMNSSPEGEQHWQTLLEPRDMETTQWHRLTPR